MKNLIIILVLSLSLISCSGVNSCLKLTGSMTQEGENYSGGIEYCWSQGKSIQAGTPVLESDKAEDVALIPVSAIEEAVNAIEEKPGVGGVKTNSPSSVLDGPIHPCIKLLDILKKRGWKPKSK